MLKRSDLRHFSPILISIVNFKVSSMRAARAASKRKLYDSSEEETVDERRYMGRI